MNCPICITSVVWTKSCPWRNSESSSGEVFVIVVLNSRADGNARMLESPVFADLGNEVSFPESIYTYFGYGYNV